MFLLGVLVLLVYFAGLMMFSVDVASAFVSPIALSTTMDCSFCWEEESTFTLYAAKKKQKKKPKSSPKRGSGGGGGFGGIANKAKSTTTRTARKMTQPAPPPPRQRQIVRTAAEIARLNTFHTKQKQIEDDDDDDNIVPDQQEPMDGLKQTETARLTTLYTQEYLQQKLASPRPGQLVQVSESPLLFTIDNFLDPAACNRVQNDATGCFDLMFPEQVSDQLFNGQESEMDGLLFNAASSRDHHEEHRTDHATAYPDGLHMDTNNQCLFRHITCILYLNDVPEECGGATVFPLARALPQDPALEAARRILEHSLSHTKSREIVSLGLETEARLLEARAGTQFPVRPDTDTAIRIQPKAGKLLVFVSRDSQGREDPRTWHAGERIRPGPDGSVTEKRILTLFKEVDYASDVAATTRRDQQTTLEGYLAPQIEEQRNWLQAKAKLQQALLASQQKEET